MSERGFGKSPTAGRAPSKVRMLVVVGSLFLGSCVLLSIVEALSGGSRPEAGTAQPAAPTATPRPAPPASKTGVALPPDPPPPVARLANQVPKFTQELEALAAYRALTASDTPATRAFLTVVSMALADSGTPHTVTLTARREKVFDPALTTYVIVARTGRLPEKVERIARDFLTSVRARPHLGVWDPANAVYDVTALAAWLHPSDADYLRELIAVRESSRGWINYAADRQMKPPWIPWLALPGAAYNRLARLTTLTQQEHRAMCDHFDLLPTERIDPESGQTVPDCGCQEGAPVTWEALRDEWPFTVPGGCLVGTGSRQVCQVVFVHRGRRYGVNGIAMGRRGNLKPDPIWADNPDPALPKVSIGPLIYRGLGLCAK